MRPVSGLLLGLLLTCLAGPAPAAGPKLEIRFCHAGQARCIALTPKAAAPFLEALRAVRADPPPALRRRIELADGEAPPPGQPLPDDWVLYRVVVLADPEGRPHHLLAIWTLVWGADVAILFRASGCGRGPCRLHPLAFFPYYDEEPFNYAEAISAHVLFDKPGDDPVLHILEWAGGLDLLQNYMDFEFYFNYSGHGEEAASIEVHELWRDGYLNGELHDLDGDRRPELLLTIRTWSMMYDYRLNAGPWLETVRIVRNGRLVPACRQYPEYFARRLAALERKIPRSILWLDRYAHIADTTPSGSRSSMSYFRRRAMVAELITEQFLAALQVGWFAPARRAARALEAFLNSGSAEERALVPEIRAFVDHVLGQAERHREAPCVLDEVEAPWDAVPLFYDFALAPWSASEPDAGDDAGAGGA